MSSWWQETRDHPSGVLLGAQLLGVLAYPFLGSRTGGRLAIGLLGLAFVAIALWAVHRSPALTWIALLVGVPVMVLTIWEALAPDSSGVVLASSVLHALFYFYVSWAMIRYLFADRSVSSDELFAVGAAFTVVAWGFAYVFAAVQVGWPGSFSGTGSGDRTWFELLFSSFANLTGVGLSDVLPISQQARAVVMVEQVSGVMYVALVISRLVGLTTSRPSAH